MAWLAGYSKRKPITITGGASGAQTDFQLKLNAVYAAAMQSDFDDLRFTQSNGTALIDAWLESKVNSDSAVVWAEFPTTPANTIEQTYYMYYGDAGAASDWDGPATFLQWHGAASVDFMDAAAVTPANSVYEARIRTGYLTHNVLYGLANNATVGDDAMYVQSYTGGNLRYVGSVNEGVTTNASEAPDFDINTWYAIKTTFDGTTVRGYVDGNEISTGVTTNLPNESLGLWMWSPTGVCEQDWSFARKYAATPPTYAFGAEESAPVGGVAPTSIFYGPFMGPLGGAI